MVLATSVPVNVLVVVALAGAFANIVGSIASAVQAIVAVRRLEAQAKATHELTKSIGRRVGMSEDELR